MKFLVKNKSTKIIFFGIGKADSIFIQNGKHNILIDTGEEKHSEKIINKLKHFGIKKIDYMLLTHPDKDHIGGAAKIINSFEIGQIFQSTFEKGNKAEKSINKIIIENKIKIVSLKENKKIKVGNLNCTIYASEKEKYKKSNDYSLVILVEDEELNYLFTGDAEKERLEEILNIDFPKIDLLKVPHHGRANTVSTKVIEKLDPAYVVITNYNSGVSKDILDKFKKQNTKLFITSEEDVNVLINKESLEFN